MSNEDRLLNWSTDSVGIDYLLIHCDCVSFPLGEGESPYSPGTQSPQHHSLYSYEGENRKRLADQPPECTKFKVIVKKKKGTRSFEFQTPVKVNFWTSLFGEDSGFLSPSGVHIV